MILRRRRLLGASALLSSLFGVGLAAYSDTTSSTPAIHTVAVGSNGFSYNPNTTIAAPGDIVVFQFYPTNHSVIRAEYTDSPECGAGGCNPCVPYELINPGKAGFHSGNILTQETNSAAVSIPIDETFEADGREQVPTWNLTINDTEPIFFYCNAVDSCHPNGMVGVINPNSSVSLANQYQAAVAAPYELAPGQPFPAEGSGSPTSAPSSPAASATNSAASSSSSHLSGGAIAGIVVGVIFVLLLAAALFYFVGRSKTYRDILGGKGSSAPGGQGSQMGDLGPWSPAGPMSPALPDARFSGTTAYSQVQGPIQGRFIGYNTQTGEPEFAADDPEGLQHGNMLGGFSPQLGGGGFVPNKHVSVELPGDGPVVAEISGSDGNVKRNGRG